MLDKTTITKIQDGLQKLDGLLEYQDKMLEDIMRKNASADPTAPPGVQPDALPGIPPAAPSDTLQPVLPSVLPAAHSDTQPNNAPINTPPAAPPPAAVVSDGAKPGPEGSKAARRDPEKRMLAGAAFYIALVAIVVVALFVNGENRAPHNLFGYSLLSVLSGSMQNEIPKDSLIIVKHVDPSTLQVGDDITYMYSSKASITHQIIAINENYTADGQRGFQTKGTENSVPDQKIVAASNVVGKVVFSIPVVGGVFQFIGDNLLLIGIFAGICVMIAILYNAIRWILRPEKPGGPPKRHAAAGA